jgi:CarD family transcriptional regulator
MPKKPSHGRGASSAPGRPTEKAGKGKLNAKTGTPAISTQARAKATSTKPAAATKKRPAETGTGGIRKAAVKATSARSRASAPKVTARDSVAAKKGADKKARTAAPKVVAVQPKKSPKPLPKGTVKGKAPKKIEAAKKPGTAATVQPKSKAKTAPETSNKQKKAGSVTSKSKEAANKPAAKKPATAAKPEQRRDIAPKAKPAGGQTAPVADKKPAPNKAAPRPAAPAAEAPRVVAGAGQTQPAKDAGAVKAPSAARPAGKDSAKAKPQAEAPKVELKLIPLSELTYEAGDHVVYPTHGVGKVLQVEQTTIAGHNLQLYVIAFDRDRMTLRVPVGKAERAGLRKLSTRKVMDDALSTLKGRARVKRTMWSRRAQEYEAKINSGDPIAIAEVVRDLHRNDGQPEQSFSERQIYEAARERLAAELAALEKVDVETATERLETLLAA